MFLIALYVLGSSIGSLLTAVCAAYMRMVSVLIIGSITQCVLLGVGFALLQLGFGIDGILWMLAIVGLLNATAFAIWLAPVVLARDKNAYRQPVFPVIRLGLAAWQTNLVSGALFKQTTIILLGYFAVSLTLRGFFNLSYQLADSANALLVAGFGGVGGSALAAAAIGRNYARLGRSWEVLIKVETLLAAPGLVFCLFNAQNIVTILYPKTYAPVGPLLAIFLFFNLIVRILGTTIHQSTLYVLSKARLVVIAQWIGLASILGLGIVLIPRYGPAGALIADGIAKALAGALLLAFLWRDLPNKYPIGFTLRFLLALTLAALPGIVWHPTNRILFGASGVIFLVLCFGLLVVIKPLSADDLEMIKGMKPGVARYLGWFARKK
jgi:O-antigen/teichoic acid export membrane protein